MRSITGSLKHFAPFAAVIGYIGMYYTGSKGINQIIPDLENISLSNLMANYQNLVIAAVAGGVIYFIRRISLPAAMKDLITIAAWGLIGYEIALAIDPPAPITYTGRVQYVPPTTYNPYLLTAPAGV